MAAQPRLWWHGKIRRVGRLLDADDCVLCLIDVQDAFVRKLPAREAAELVDRIRWLCRLAEWLGVPIVVTEEEPEENGETAPVIVDSLASESVRHSKPVFDLSASPAILADVLRHRRDIVVLCGLETDVCIAQSALGLLDRGKRVVVVEDAVASPGTAHEQGLGRMSRAGVELIGLKGLAYEWLRTAERASAFNAAAQRDVPADIVL